MAKGEKTGGRKKGTPNKATAEIRAQIKQILDAVLPDALNIIKAIEDPKKQIDAITNLLPYVVAKKTENQITGGEGIDQIEIIIKKPSDDT
jgi:hypothetical protein